VLESLNGALTADAALLSAAERQVIDEAAARLSAVAQGNQQAGEHQQETAQH
jgi:molecular chaperone HscA